MTVVMHCYEIYTLIWIVLIDMYLLFKETQLFI